MRNAERVLSVHRDRGSRGLPLERVYRHLFNPEFYLRAYAKTYRNAGAMTKGSTDETVDGMSMARIQRIIELVRAERYRWMPVRRTLIPKSHGGTRPLGIPTWSDKLLQEVLRMLLEAYYDPRFSDSSHGFRPGRGCHTALADVQKWRGVVWFIEGDIKGCFDNIDHEVLLDILREDIHDGRVVRLIAGLLKAGYMEDWQRKETLSGTPQGGILSPLLSNIYLDRLDRFVEDELIPQHTCGQRRRVHLDYKRFEYQILKAKQSGDWERVTRLKRERRQFPSVDPFDPNFRRLWYTRYADDFLLGFIGSKAEAESIRDRLQGFLSRKLKLQLSVEKTLITHARDRKARFLGFEVTSCRSQTKLAASGKRSINGLTALLMPADVGRSITARYCKRGKPIHRIELTNDSDYTIIQRYQSVLRGLYNYYCIATNVAARMNRTKWILETSLAKTLAHKHKISVTKVFRRYAMRDEQGHRICGVIGVTIERDGKKPLVATFGGFPIKRERNVATISDFSLDRAWYRYSTDRSELVQRLIFNRCELCGAEGNVETHHIRKLKDLDKPGRRPKAPWERFMSSRRRKTIVVCQKCHAAIHGGRYDGTSLRSSLESRVQ
ncbi:MAG: maturase [Planctomycetes bacterium]|nr:maturase [Planctomycetota bacterium]